MTHYESLAASGPAPLEGHAAREGRHLRVAGWTICALAAAIPSDYVAAALAAERGADSFRAPSVYLGLIAIVVSAPLVLQFGKWRKGLPPILLLFAAIALSVVVLFSSDGAEVMSGDAAPDRPFKLVVMGVLFAWIGWRPHWRARLVTSFLAGWGLFIAVSILMILTGRADVAQHYGTDRASVLGLNQNQQSIAAAIGMVLLLAQAISARRKTAALAAAAAFVGGGVVFSVGNSRTALLALAVACVYVVLGAVRQSIERPWTIVRMAVALVAIAGAIVWVAGRSAEFADATDAMDRRVRAGLEGEDLGSRDALAVATIELALRNPRGIGFGNAVRELGLDPHNGYLKIWAEGGVLAAAVAILALIAMARVLAGALRDPGLFGAGGALLMLAVAAAGGQAMLQFSFWFFLAIVSAGSARERLRERLERRARAVAA